MFFQDGYTGPFGEHSLRTFLDFGSPKGGYWASKLVVWCHFGEPKGDRKVFFSLKAPRNVPGRDFKEIWNGSGRCFGCVFGNVFYSVLD